MHLAYHLTLGMRGFWLPNDQRGSGSRYVGSRRLYEFGKATKVATRRSVAHRPFDPRQRNAAKSTLKYPPVRLSGEQALAIARGVDDYRQRSGLTIWACAIMPDHLHLVVGLPHLKWDSLATQLKASATKALVTAGIHPLAQYGVSGARPPKVFARRGWCVYLDTAADVRRTIPYVEENPLRQGLPRQHWSFVTPFEG